MNSIRMKEVAARVVAWHNRHPLAQRVTLGQVDGIGVIALPFVTASERGGATVRPDLVAPRVVVEPSFEPPVLDESVSVIESAMAGQDGAAPPPEAAAAEDSPKPRLRDRAAAQGGDEALPAMPVAGAPEPRPPVPAWHPKAWAQTLRRWLWPGSRTGFQGVFSEDFIAPISPKQVSRWALAHGSTTWPGETHWPRREVAPDGALLSRATGGSGVEPVTLYLVTAAIVTHKGRLRVLLGRDGRALGPRQFSLMRILLASALVLGLAAGAAWSLWGPGAAEGDAPDTAASAPAGAASTAAARAPASAVAPPQPTLLIAPDLVPRPVAASAPTVVASSPEPTPAPATALIMDKSVPSASPQASAPAAARTSSSPPSTPSPAVAAPRPRAPSLNEGKLAAMGGSLGISEADKQAALAESRRLRASEPKAKEAPPAPPAVALGQTGRGAKPAPASSAEAPAAAKPQAAELGLNAASARQTGATGPRGQRFYALVSKSSFTKVEADARMVQLRSAAANAIAPAGTRIEVIQARNAWQAVWWPFAKREDAERARGLLAARGMPVDIVEF